MKIMKEDNLKVQKAMLIYEVIRQFADFKWEKEPKKCKKILFGVVME